MTASRIFSFLNQQQINVGSSWSTVRLILDQCEIRQKISEQEVERIFNSDMAAEELLLEDFSIPNAIDYISEVCEKFGFDPDLSTHLKTLMITDFHAPYLCMLHFQLIISEVFNHKMINAYEFKPRGESVLWLSARYKDSNLDVGLSPFLNNSKSVENLDLSWASTKKEGNRHSAIALVNILTTLDKLSDPSRVGIGRYIRALLYKNLRLSREKTLRSTTFISKLSTNKVLQLLSKITLGNTGTYGVLEQRLCEILSIWQLDNEDLWSKRGFGDSVFTTNTSRQKLGDIEFKNKFEPKILAFEAHAGHLTQKYVDDHLASAKKISTIRRTEFEERDALENWEITIRFLVHGFEPGIQKKLKLSGIPTKIECVLYKELIPNELSQSMLDKFDLIFTQRLNTNSINQKIRDRVLQLLA